MPCSAVTLSLATISGVVSAALLAIAVGTDNWQFIRVNRIEIEKNIAGSGISSDDFHNQGLYFTRTKGLFRTCYPEALPNNDMLHRSPFETQCEFVDFHIFDQDTDTSAFSDNEMRRLHMARSMIALFFVSFFLMVAAFFTGVAGCWRRSPANISTTAFLMLGACVLAAGAMGLWHGVDYFEEQRIRAFPYKSSWDSLLVDSTGKVYDWSYFLGWVGLGWSLMSALLFFGASVCLRHESLSHYEAKAMPYAVAANIVYPQKAQYAQYGAGYGYGYNYPPQYGHYNY